MIANYLRIALRHMLREKGYTIITLAGLALGMASFILVSLVVWDEVSFDRFHANADRIFRLTLDVRLKDREFITAKSSPPLAPMLSRDIPGVEASTRIRYLGDHPVRYDGRAFTEYRVLAGDSALFRIFTFEVLEGDPRTFLREPNTVVLSDLTARKYFGDQPALGKMLTIDGTVPYLVCGVVKAMPPRSHWHFPMILSANSRAFGDENNWINNGLYTYVLLRKGARVEDVEAACARSVTDHVRPIIRSVFGAEWSDMEAQGMHYRYHFQPLTAIHLYSDLDEELEPTGTILIVTMIGIIGAFVLVLACINFMNLSTARSARRAKEVGVRKVLGADRTQLIQQFLSEAILLAMVAFVLSMIIIEIALPPFNALTGKQLLLRDLDPLFAIPAAISLLLIVGVLAGSYPAFVLSSFRPAAVLKGAIRTGMRGGRLRSMLVVSQFAISIALVIGTLVVSAQLRFVQNRDLGFTKEGLLVVDNTWQLRDRHDAFKQLILTRPGIAGAAFTQNLPGNDVSSAAYRAEGGDQGNLKMMRQLWAEADYLPVLGVRIKEGRHLSQAFATDSGQAVVINEAAARLLGYSHPVGRIVYGYFGDGERPFRIVGMTEDFHYEPLHVRVQPTVVLVPPGPPTRIVIRFHGDPQAVMEDVRAQWDTFSGGQPFTGFFLDSRLERYYDRDRIVGTMLTILASLGLFISSLGLLGLAMYAIEQRTKELGIRKIFGASTADLAGLLTREFAKLVLIANIIAWPLAYIAMDRWLDSFAYRISLGPEIFILAGGIAMLIAMVTVGYNTVRAAVRNPVEALRYE